MSDDNLIPISDQQAKLGKEIVGASRELGGYLADILGDLPKDLVGLLAGDRVKASRSYKWIWERKQAARGNYYGSAKPHYVFF
jgi:hypothetical protein